MITEATYPFAPGGVSVWCDQVLRGVHDRRFEVVAITASCSTPRTWALPPNVAAVRTVGLWDRAPRPHEAAPVPGAIEAFLDAVVGDADLSVFLEALHGLFLLAQRGALASVLLDSRAVDAVLEALRAGGASAGPATAPATVADAVEILSLLEHFMRPLSIEPPRAPVCHSVSNGLGVLVALGAKWTHGSAFLLTEHGLYLRERFLEYGAAAMSEPVRLVLLRFMSRLVRAGYEIADRIAPASSYNHAWELASGAPADKIRLIYNGVDPAAFPRPGEEPEQPTLSWLGRIDPLKDLHTLIESFALVREELPGARLRLFGGVPSGNEAYARSCHDLVDRLDLERSLSFEGRVDSVFDAYCAGNLVLNTSISEGFPYAVLEAMASGRCVVATDVGGVEEAIGDAGVLVPPRDPPAIAGACLDLLEDRARRVLLASAARRRVRSLFTVDQSNHAYRELYAELAATVAASRPQAVPRPLPAGRGGAVFAQVGNAS